ncbi:DNA-binding NtrC family response regulator [Paenibacillus sp. 1182]|uniref:hypothetical protein n=1 Tax=Paenibacillus sp. 1182 TaxID=2806565 RepID=UPI001AE568F5|nr:hypothetical protein [Paenibacillus sp. 1182]MBP1308732.1 DNA-binding NtrC family response regulator [Paenibacillus sp. 1182]
MARRKNDSGMSFEHLAKVIHSYLLEQGWELNFRGFREVLRRYFRLQDHDIVEIHELMIECNLWFNYFSEVQSFIDLKKEEWSLEADWLIAQEKMAEPSEALEDRIQNAKLRAKQFGIFSNQLESQKKFFSKASGHCQSLYKNATIRLLQS